MTSTLPITCRFCPQRFACLEDYRRHRREAHARDYRRRIKLAEARGWFELFGDDRTLISENGARYFRWLLGQVAERRGE